MKTRILQKLNVKPNITSLGFTKEELEGVAETVSQNLSEESSEEQIEAEVEKTLKILKVSQQAANRVINATKTKAPKGADDPDPNKGGKKPEEAEDEPSWFSKYREETESKLQKLQNANLAESRRKLFEATIEGLLPKQKEAMLKDFDRVSFKDEEDFEAYRKEKEALVLEINQELANEGLSKMAKPASGTKAKSDEDEFVKLMEDINKQ